MINTELYLSLILLKLSGWPLSGIAVINDIFERSQGTTKFRLAGE